jgi:hypothetical protein
MRALVEIHDYFSVPTLQGEGVITTKGHDSLRRRDKVVHQKAKSEE